jgi:hypothetical protein
LIPLFATLFASQPPRSFYDENVKREEAIFDDAAKLRESLTEVFNRRPHPVVWRERGRKVKAVAIQAAAIEQTPDDHFLLSVTGTYRNFGRQFIVGGSFVVWVEVLFREGVLTVRPNGSSKAALAVALTRPGKGSEEDPSPPRFSPPISHLFPSLPGTFGGSATTGTMTLPLDTYNQMERFRVAVEGDPTVASGLWWRMAYLSVVTITTLGFGDITPLTEEARLLIASEAVLGVIVVGLFLNALAVRVRRGNQPSDQAA